VPRDRQDEGGGRSAGHSGIEYLTRSKVPGVVE
jgi:hypothetical protein